MTPSSTPRTLLAAQILWPAFLAAAILEMVVFSWVVPAGLQFGSWQPSAQTVYSVSFLVFWAACATASLMTHWVRAADAAVSRAHDAMQGVSVTRRPMKKAL